ncbi:thioredoxin domain-containing protein [Mucilaginibacter sp. RS28]|uniref:Thioredoxin domain-containing protein n=1 Tax=Mucilaginibacter straminoryzae TaxID=2932774 RepID=A0A9X1X9Z2_9SPHI|nr:thioredoxin domain-containing protein [Mucilaginibacter straminoryzae]MCJ8210934.1 thioredoxin domain-containing protein [Mucilaginibacter straminoryzae]
MNRLANSASPYLLQHANNPVDWHPWGAEALQKARDENKLIIVSIGYSACHWCHVMEHESFEDEQVAQVMNDLFICIKVDREERPDIDQIYMSAIQLMTGRGGWPLNCICLPDQRPIYGGTYFRKQDWISLLLNLSEFYREKPQEAEEYAVRLTEGIRQYESVNFMSEQPTYSKDDLEAIVATWRKTFDMKEGGTGHAPKFPMPNNWLFLMRYAHLMKDEQIGEVVELTLKKMAYGGIYDHIGGGFARYSVDARWHVPHFEKMLYDNGQLVSLYAEAYTRQPDELYKEIVAETIAFVERELTSPEFGFYSALDADSEGVEGKFYTFTGEELEQVLGKDAAFAFKLYYGATDEGNWEEEQTNVLFRAREKEALADNLGYTLEEFDEELQESRRLVFEYRSQRVRPGLDHKIIASWNGLMLKGLCEAARVFPAENYQDLALKNAAFIRENLISADGKLNRIYGSAERIAFLDDYANVIDAFITLYELTFDLDWLTLARSLTNDAIVNYYDQQEGMFFYTSAENEELIARKCEIMDGVIPSSNSVMARNLKKLSLFFEDESYGKISSQLLCNLMPYMAKYGSVYSNWSLLLLEEVFGIYEVAITGTRAETVRQEFDKNYVPNKIILGGTQENLPLLQNRVGSTTRIFICKDKTCGLPADTVADALKQIAN